VGVSKALYGRDADLAAITAVLDGARTGRGGVLVIRGEAGMGKTALLDLAERSAADMTVLRATAVETEAALPFAGLHLLLRPVLSDLSGVPGPRARALERVLGLASGPVQPRDDVVLASLAVVSLLSTVAEKGPVLCLIDDTQWLDSGSATTMLFAARRLDLAGVAIVLAIRERSDGLETSSLPERYLQPLGDEAARRLIADEAAELDPMLIERVLGESAGNPLAITELSRSAMAEPGLRADRPPGPLQPGQRVQQIYGQQIAGLPQATRMLLLVAAAAGSGELALVLPAGQALGLDASALGPAEEAGLVSVTHRAISFRHPMVRAAAYHDAPIAMRQAAHRALGEALANGGTVSVGTRAWHLAAAAAGRDDAAAAELELAAEQARPLSGYAAVAAAYERSAELTTDPAVRARRLVAAAHAASDIGDATRAGRLLTAAENLSADPLIRAEVAYLRTRAYGADHRASLVALAEAVEGVAGSHPGRALRLLRGLVIPARMSGQDKLAATVTERLAELEIAFRDAADEGEPGSVAVPDDRLLTGVVAWWRGDHDTALTISARLASECRERGALGALVGVLHGYGLALAAGGDWAAARSALLEMSQVAADLGQPVRVGHAAALLAVLAALEDDETAYRSWLEIYERHDIADDAWGYCTALPAIVEVSRGRFSSALTRFRRFPPEKWRDATAFWYLPDIVEAASRAGDQDWAREAAAVYAGWAAGTGQAWALAVAARCRGLSDSSARAERHFTEALRWHSGAGRPMEEARTKLVYGELLRRRKRRADAAEQLTRAIQVFDDLGAAAYARRARSELAATGLSADRADAPGMLARLTRQEYQIATLAAQGESNREIGARLFLSHRTVGYHLYKAYPKLGVTARTQLAGIFARETRARRDTLGAAVRGQESADSAESA
jgi:DNA-binding CsgD family transcriptional regulator